MQILTVAALIVIGILLFELIIFSHEFGHFITAKLSGVKVNEFALGMGPKIISFVKGETRYSLRLFPIGGYCAMEGEDEDSEEKKVLLITQKFEENDYHNRRCGYEYSSRFCYDVCLYRSG